MLSEDLNQSLPNAGHKLVEEQPQQSCKELAAEFWTAYRARNNSIIQDIFAGQLKTTLTCKHCGHRRRTFDPFLDLSLPLPEGRPRITLHDCFRLLLQQELLEGTNALTCPKCKRTGRTLKDLSIFRFPQTLVLHLKRFRNNGQKVSTWVDFPVAHGSLDLTQFLDRNAPPEQVHFALYAVVNHFGAASVGHYDAWCYHEGDGQWHCYDDANVARVPPDCVVRPEAYLLFFRRL
eukprot:EG_transcript_26401